MRLSSKCDGLWRVQIKNMKHPIENDMLKLQNDFNMLLYVFGILLVKPSFDCQAICLAKGPHGYVEH